MYVRHLYATIIAVLVGYSALPAWSQIGNLACADPNVLCVDDTPGSTQEYATIQAAVNVVQAGQTVLVHDGNYAGFQITRSGNSNAPITIRAQGSAAVINSGGPTGDGARFQNVSYVTVEGFTIRGMPQRCVAARGATATTPMTGNILRNNSCSNAGSECFYLSQFGSSLVENNTINTCGTGGGTRNHGLYLANGGSDNTVIRGNSISDTRGSESAGIHMNGDLSIGGDGVISGVTIENNVIFGSTHNGINMDGVQNTLLRNNLVYGNRRNAIRAYAIDGAAGPQNLRIVNNTLRASVSGWAVKLSEDLGGHTVFNNILLGVSGALSVANSAISSNNNAGSDRYSVNGEASTVTLAQWRSTTAQDANSLVSTPAALFVNAATSDYRLNTAPVSVAVNAGRASLNGVNAPTSDRAGGSRPQGSAYDIGAYEQNGPGGLLPTVSLTATPASIGSGGSSTLNWSSTNASSCSASGAWTGSRATSGSQSTGALAATSTYTLTCSSSLGTAAQAATVTVTPAAALPTVSLTATPASISSGGSSTLNWSSTNASSCSASGAWTGSRATSGSQSTGALTATSTYTLTCSGAGGTAVQAATVTVTPAAALPTVSLTATPASINSGGSSTLSWSSTNASSCSASGAWTGSRATSGSQSTGALTATSTYTLTCSGAGGTAVRAATVTVTPAAALPTVSLTATPASINSGGSSTLNWSSTNASSCSASGAWTGSRATSGSQSTGALTATSTYTLTCSGAGGTAVQAATVTVTPAAALPTVSLTATPASISSGGSSTLNWSSTNASSCSASGAWTGSRATSGSQSTGALTATSTYTLTCSGAGGTAVQAATVTVSPTTSGSVFYVAPTGGSDSYSGIETAPWATFDHAWKVLKPGDTLVVKDGTYQQAMVPRMSGAAGNPITIRAQNVGRAIITPADNAMPAANACYNGEQNIAIHVYTCQGSNPRLVHDLIIDGFIARGKGENSAISVGSSDSANLEAEMTYNIVVRNTGAFGSITGTNNVVFSVGNNLRDSLFEDVFAYGAGRKAMSAFGSIRVTIRRAVVRYDFWTGNQYKPNDPRLSFSGYNTVDSVFENMIAIDAAPARGAESASRGGFAASGNVTDVNGITASSNNKYHGIISLNNIGNGFELDGGSSTYPMSNISLENVISWGNTGSGINIQRNSAGAKILHSTVGANSGIGVRLDPYPPTPITGTEIRNTYSYLNGHRGYSHSSSQASAFQNNSAYRNAQQNNIGGVMQGDIEVAYAPTLTYLINPAKVAGFERGATIVDRYVNGAQTTTPLWPWPNEDLIKSHMCNAVDLASVDRNRSGMTPNWCLSNKTLTNYIWEYMGSTTPPSIYGR